MKLHLVAQYEGSIAWVVGPMEYGCLAQGDTLAQAESRLIDNLYLNAAIHLKENRKPLQVEDASEEQLEYFSNTEGCHPWPKEEPDKSLKYTKVIELDCSKIPEQWLAVADKLFSFNET